MNLINLLCLTFLTTCACALSNDTVSTTSDIVTSTSDSMTTVSSPTEETSDETTFSSEPTVTPPESFSSSNASKTPSYKDETDITTEALDADASSTIDTQSTTEANFERVGDAEKDSKIPHINNTKVETRSDRDGSETPLELSPDNGHKAESLEKDIEGNGKNLKNVAGNKSTISKGKAAGILISSCIIAVALIWISKIIYSRYRSKTYDLRQDIQMGNP